MAWMVRNKIPELNSVIKRKMRKCNQKRQNSHGGIRGKRVWTGSQVIRNSCESSVSLQRTPAAQMQGFASAGPTTLQLAVHDISMVGAARQPSQLERHEKLRPSKTGQTWGGGRISKGKEKSFTATEDAG